MVQMNLIMKQQQTHRLREWTYGYQYCSKSLDRISDSWEGQLQTPNFWGQNIKNKNNNINFRKIF